ncbi:unnamed protein product [Urochloa humidicola]
MENSECPPWIDPGNAFRLVVKCEKYKANLEYGMLDMDEQEHVVWLDRCSGYNLDKFLTDMSSKIIWGPSQTLAVWAVDTDSAAEWKVRRNEHFEKMIQSRFNEKLANVVVEVVDKVGYQLVHSSVGSIGSSGVTSHSEAVCPPPNAEGVGDTCSSPELAEQIIENVDWSTLTIIPEPDQDGEANVLVDENAIFDAMGFKAADERAQDASTEEASIPVIPPAIQQDMEDVGILIDDKDPTEPILDWDRDNPDMSVGTIYPCMNDFRLAVRQHAIVDEFELGTEKSDKSRFRGYCKANGCPWIIRARTQADGCVRVQINSSIHHCASRSRVLGTMANQAWVAERAIPLLKKEPGMGAREIGDALQDKYKIQIHYQTVWYGRQRAADKLFGKWDDSFDWLYRFKAEVELRSPGSIVEIHTVKVDEKEHFSRFFCAFKGSIDGFKNGCRPYISIDSTALNGEWNGHMPAALALDGHNWMFPLAFGLFDSETKDNWIWFMEQLGRAIGDVPKLAVCTDACKGLEAAVKKVFPWAEQRECFRHLMENMKKSFTGEVYAANMWPAARSYSAGKHKYFMDKVFAASPNAETWLQKNHNLLWARSKFSTDIKCDYINNNLAESWNAWIKKYKDLPVHCMVDAIREKGVIMFERRRRISRALHGVILPAVIQQLNAGSKGLGHLKVTKGLPDQAEVTEIYKDEEVRRHVVYLNEHSCTCREWQVTGKPCPHALAVITSDRQPDMEKYVDMAYSVQSFRAAYDAGWPNITDRNQWPDVEKGFKLHPPIGKKRGVGRQRKNRIPSCLERSGKATRQVKCDNCGERGHRKGSWKCSLTGTKKRKRTKKSKSKPGRKKAKNDSTTQPVEATTPRTRAAIAREAAVAAIKAAEEAEAEAAAVITARKPTSSPGPSTRRYAF